MEETLETRDRKRPLKVYVTPTERQAIERLAAVTRLSVSDYLRNVGLAYQPPSAFDQEAVLTLARINADQGRLGGLLKLWLSEKPGEGAPVKDVREVLHKIEDLQGQMIHLLLKQPVKRS